MASERGYLMDPEGREARGGPLNNPRSEAMWLLHSHTEPPTFGAVNRISFGRK